MESQIIISRKVFSFLSDLVDTLLEKEYFSYIENAEEYIHKIFDFIANDLVSSKHYRTPQKLIKHGNYYVFYNAGKRTAWYIFFDKKGHRYFIEYITNNHVAKAAFLKDLK